MMRQKERANKTHKAKMQSLFTTIDENGDGQVDIDEFEQVFREPALQTWLAAQVLQASDARSLFSLLDKGTGRVSPDDLIGGVGKLKGSARSVDVAFLRQDIHR